MGAPLWFVWFDLAYACYHAHTQCTALAVWDLATLLMTADGMRGIFPSTKMPMPTRTTPSDLANMGYDLKPRDNNWEDEEVRYNLSPCTNLREHS